MPKRFLAIPRAAIAAIVMIAAALVLLRPVCESWHRGAASHAGFVRVAMSTDEAAAPADDTSDAACCSLGDAGIVSAVRAMALDRSGDSPSLGPPFVPAAFIVLSVVAPTIFRRRPLPRAPRSYCLRSARILR